MDFKIPDHYETGVLNGDDLIFFYYDIGLDNLQGWPLSYDWGTIVNEFKDLADIASCDKTDIPKQLVDNQIRFTVSQEKDSDNGSESCAFFRHLRNALLTMQSLVKETGISSQTTVVIKNPCMVR